MESLFENRYVRDKQLIKAICCYLYFGRRILIICQAILLTCFACSFLLAILGYSINWIVLIGVPLYFVYKLIVYFLQVKRMMQRDLEMYGEVAFVETVVTEEGLHTTSSGGTQMLLSYENITNVTKYKKYVLVFTKAKLMYILPKDGFTKGTAEEFVLYLKSKTAK